MHADEQLILAGSNLDILSTSEAIRRIKQFLRLPYELLDHAAAQITDIHLRNHVKFLLHPY
jgi:hypothetical protein